MIHVAELYFVVVTEHGGLEGDAGGQVVDGKLLDVACVAVAPL